MRQKSELWNSVCFDQKWKCAEQALRIIRKKFKKMREFCFGQKISQFVTESRSKSKSSFISSCSHLFLNGQFWSLICCNPKYVKLSKIGDQIRKPLLSILKASKWWKIGRLWQQTLENWRVRKFALIFCKSKENKYQCKIIDLGFLILFYQFQLNSPHLSWMCSLEEIFSCLKLWLKISIVLSRQIRE